MGSKNHWGADAMKGTLISDMENEVLEGIRKTNTERQSGGLQSGQSGEQSGGQAPGQASIQPVREITAPVIQPLASTKNSQQQGQASIYHEPTQNINIPIPTSQHTRLKIISAQTRQPMKDMVVQAIGLWLDVQEGKKGVKSE